MPSPRGRAFGGARGRELRHVAGGQPPVVGLDAGDDVRHARADAAQDALLAALSEDERRELERLL
jgi:hypothetical protein